MSLFKFSFNRYVLITVLLFSAQNFAFANMTCFKVFKSPLETVILGKETVSSKDSSEEMALSIVSNLQELARSLIVNNPDSLAGSRLLRQDIDSYLSKSLKKSMSEEGVVIDGNIASDLARSPSESRIYVGYVRTNEISFRAREVSVGIMIFNRSSQSSATSIELKILQNDFSRQVNEGFMPTHSTYEISRMQSISTQSSDQSTSISNKLGALPFEHSGAPTKAQRRLDNPTDWEAP